MGLDCSHGAWHGAYSAFMTWRTYICDVAGLGNLLDYEGYKGFGGTDPNGIEISSIKDEGLRILIDHSDCDGEFTPEECKLVADSLSLLIPKISGDLGGHIGDVRQKTQQFIDGCLLAHSLNENLIFN